MSLEKSYGLIFNAHIFWLNLHHSTARRREAFAGREGVLWNRHNRLSLCFPGGTLHALVSASLTAADDQIHHDMWTTKSYKNACFSALTHAHTHMHAHQTVLEGKRALHYLPGTQAYPYAQGALHVTEQSEIFKHRIQRKKPPRQIAALQHEIRCRRLTVPEQKFSPDKAFWLEIGRVQSSACSGQFFKLARD